MLLLLLRPSAIDGNKVEHRVCLYSQENVKKNELYDVYFTAQLQAVWTYLISKIMPIFYCLIQNYRQFTDYTNKTLCSTLFLRPGTKFTEGLSNSSNKQKGVRNCRLNILAKFIYLFYLFIYSYAKSQVFRSFFLGSVWNILPFCWVYANLASVAS